MMFRTQPTADQLQRNFPAIFAESEKETLSDKYLYIPTFKLIEGLEKQGFSIVGAKQSASRALNSRKHAKHVVYMTHDSMEKDVIEASFKVIDQFPKQVQLITSMKQIELSRDEQMILAESAANLAFEENEIKLNKELGRDIVPKLLTVRRWDDKKTDLWTTFNVVQENVIKGGIRVIRENEEGRRSFSKTRAVNSIDRDAKLNKELMSLAQKILSLKTGVSA